MSYSKLPENHSATEAVDNLFKMFNEYDDRNVERESRLRSYLTKEDKYTYHHFRCVFDYSGDVTFLEEELLYSVPKIASVVYFKNIDTENSTIEVVVDTKAMDKSEHPDS